MQSIKALAIMQLPWEQLNRDLNLMITKMDNRKVSTNNQRRAVAATPNREMLEEISNKRMEYLLVVTTLLWKWMQKIMRMSHII